METLTIKLLHERRSSNSRRKIDGRSGKLYSFMWSDEHKAYCFTTSSQEEVDDLFYSQGRSFGSFFAPVITLGLAPFASTPKEPQEESLPEDVIVALIERGLDFPGERNLKSIGQAIIAAFDKGREAAQAASPAPAALEPEAKANENATEATPTAARAKRRVKVPETNLGVDRT